MDREMIVVTAGFAVLIGAIYLFVYFVAFRPTAGESSADSQAVYAAAEQFVEGLSSGDIRAAWQAMDPPFRDAVSLSRFEAAVAANTYLASLTGASMGSYVRHGDTATLSGTLDARAGRLPAELHLARRDGQWYLVEVILAGRPALPAASGG